jgi:putative flavoprotein involved in K+ transport
MRTTTVVIGAGQSGLAASWWLAQRRIDHVVLERGEVANTWKRERWESLRLLTPNWQSRLPGYGYVGDDPDGFRTMPETIAFLEGYARAIAAPVQTATTVTAVRRRSEGYEVETDRGIWHADAVILASGAFNLPQIPAVARSVPAGIVTLGASEYRNPAQLDPGGVLIVGASATGAQLADEIRRSGRAVTLAVGEHVRVPRVYRGRDIQWWMDAVGLLDETFDTIDDIVRARNVASLQLAGYPDRRDIDLNSLTAIGVKLVGRLAGINAEGKAQFSGSLRNVCALADLKMHRLLTAIDAWATERGLDAELEAPRRYEPTQVEASPPLLLDLTRGAIKTILWATGFRPDYSWLQVPVLDAKGNIRHDGGVVTEAPGLYVMGLPFLRRRKSSLIDGVGDDARDLTAHLAEYLGTRVEEPRTLSRSAAGA